MSDKEVVMEALKRLPESVTLEEISEEIAILAAIRRGESAADAGHVLSHDGVRQKLSSSDSTRIPSPPWHAEILAARAAEIESGEAKFLTLDQLKERLNKS